MHQRFVPKTLHIRDKPWASLGASIARVLRVFRAERGHASQYRTGVIEADQSSRK